MNLFIDFSNEKDHPSIHDRYLSGRYSQTYPSRKQDTPEFFFPGTGIRTEERDSFIFRYAFYSVEKPRKITKQHLLKEYAGVPLEKGAYNRNKYPI